MFAWPVVSPSNGLSISRWFHKHIRIWHIDHLLLSVAELQIALQWLHNERDGVTNHQPHECLLNRFFRHRSKKISKLRVTGLCEGNSMATGEFPAQRVSSMENVSIWWRHHGVNWRNCYNSFSVWITSVEFLLNITRGLATFYFMLLL